ncbi:hypothetical protein [Devosia sp.]|uniref:hypothetical protein n=1 Tax=Devosia sp. TaxID=1871048 RepID=UPI0032646686
MFDTNNASAVPDSAGLESIDESELSPHAPQQNPAIESDRPAEIAARLSLRAKCSKSLDDFHRVIPAQAGIQLR